MLRPTGKKHKFWVPDTTAVLSVSPEMLSEL